jgi:plastocyanin
MADPLPQASWQGRDYGGAVDVRAAIQREKNKPRIGLEPLSLWLMALYGIAIFSGGFYLGRYSGAFNGDSLYPQMGTPQRVSSDSTPRQQITELSPAVGQPGASQIITVAIRNMKFNPSMVEVKAGDVVEWKNDDITPHTATSAAFDSGSIEPEKSWRRTFAEAGEFRYACTFHPEMKAVVTVKDR